MMEDNSPLEDPAVLFPLPAYHFCILPYILLTFDWLPRLLYTAELASLWRARVLTKYHDDNYHYHVLQARPLGHLVLDANKPLQARNTSSTCALHMESIGASRRCGVRSILPHPYEGTTNDPTP